MHLWYLDGFSTAIFTTKKRAENYIKNEAEALGLKYTERMCCETFSVYDYEYESEEMDIGVLTLIPVDPVYGENID